MAAHRATNNRRRNRNAIPSDQLPRRVAKLVGFYAAEEYHQNYLAQHPNQLYIVINDKPKLEALKKQFPTIYSD